MAPLLDVQDLHTHLFTEDGVVQAVRGLSFDIERGETVAVVGESGCGKSMAALSIMQLVPDPPGRIVEGRVLLEGSDLLTLSEKEMLGIRGGEISMIFQEPMTSLNPVFTVGDQIMEALQAHSGLSRRAARARAVELLDTVRIPDPQLKVDEYPHRLSGGMRQRVMIAMALACEPKLLIADEPTTALDVTIQAQILELLRELQGVFGTAVLLITHDLGVVAEMADRVVVVYAGHKVEQADVTSLFAAPLHPYTVGLLGSTPNPERRAAGVERLQEMPGMVPSLFALPEGCAFSPRCPRAMPVCAEIDPPATPIGTAREVACHAVVAEFEVDDAARG